MNNIKMERWRKVLVTLVMGAFLFLMIGGVAKADSGGFSDESTGGGSTSYSKYALDNYQLDFYVDTSWDWLPWHWKRGIGKSVDTALYKITDGIWSFTRTLSNGTGFLVQEAFNFDFVGQSAETIGGNIQKLAGISSSGFTGGGFYGGLLIFVVLFLGIYLAYVGGLKREVSKAFSTALRTVVIFAVTTGLIAYAPSMIKNINSFSSEMSTYALSIGLDILGGDTGDGENSVDSVRGSVFMILVEKPWLLLQYGTTDISSITDGETRVHELLSTSPDANSGQDREDAVSDEIAIYGNQYMSVNKVASRLGSVLLILIVDIAISIFILLLCGLMIFSQLIFILYILMLPICWVLSMIPTFSGMFRRSIERLFNVVLLRVGYTLIIVIAFSISSLLYDLSETMPFLLIALLQIVCFAGVYMFHKKLLGMMSLQADENQGLIRQMRMGARRTQRTIGRTARSTVRGVQKVKSGITRAATVFFPSGSSSSGSGSSGSRSPGGSSSGSGSSGSHSPGGSSSGTGSSGSHSPGGSSSGTGSSGSHSPGGSSSGSGSSGSRSPGGSSSGSGSSGSRSSGGSSSGSGSSGSRSPGGSPSGSGSSGNRSPGGSPSGSGSSGSHSPGGSSSGSGSSGSRSPSGSSSGSASSGNHSPGNSSSGSGSSGSRSSDSSPSGFGSSSNSKSHAPTGVTHTPVQANLHPESQKEAVQATHTRLSQPTAGQYKVNGKTYTRKQMENFTGLESEDRKKWWRSRK